jgi:transposase
MEACAGSHWLARQLAGMGHEPRLISPQFVRPFVAGNKNDFGDAQAICEAACRPSMRFVSPRNEAQQTVSALHRLRERLVRERTATVNQMHGFLLEFGISLPRGAALMSRLPTVLDHETLPPRLVALVVRLRAHVHYLEEQIRQVEQDLKAALREDDKSRRLLEIPGIGPITASALAVELGDARQFANARQFSASIGLVPRQYSTGGKPTLLGISKRGDRNLRRLLVQCARAVMQHTDSRTDAMSPVGQNTLDATPLERCGLRAGQQAGADRLGRPRKGHTLRGACADDLSAPQRCHRLVPPGFATWTT